MPTFLHKRDQSSLSWYLDFCLYHLLLACFLFCLSSGKLTHYLSVCRQRSESIVIIIYQTSCSNSFIIMLEKYMHICMPCQILPRHLPPSYLINRFPILGTFLLLCFYFGFSFLQFFLIYNLNLKWYIKNIKITATTQLKHHWQVQLSKGDMEYGCH